MADRLDFYFRQPVTEAELDLAFELLENADRDLAADLGIYGIIHGAEPTPHAPVADLSVDLTAPCRAYDHLGQRIFFGTGQRVDCSVDFAGIPTDVPIEGEERWLGVFLAFDRQLSDPRTDGNSQEVLFRRDESFRLIVRQAAPAPSGQATQVPLEPDALLVCDIRRRHGQSQILADDIDTERRQAFVFAQGDAVSIVSGAWSTLAPAAETAQAALDAVDAELTAHVTGQARRHPARDIDIAARGFVEATDVEGAVHGLIDGLTSAAAGAPGAQRIGADAVPGTPHALAAGHVDGQLSQILAWLNLHVGAATGAHHASAISAAAHSFLSGTSVQAQLQQLVTMLGAQDAGAAGASRIGAADVAGSPHALAAGTAGAQLAALLAIANGDRAALDALSAVYAGDHVAAGEPDAGQHRTIRQPVLAGTKALLWDAAGVGGASAHLRVYADDASVWFTVNAAWDGGQWVRDTTTAFAGGFRFSRGEFALLNERGTSPTFATWTNTWTLPMGSATNSAFETTGAIREIGRLGMQGTNIHDAPRNMAMGGAVTFRCRFPATPSSITLSVKDASNGWAGTPSLTSIDRDGFGFYHYLVLDRDENAWWFGTYTAVA
ncbi:hypothetical protein [Haliangium ochraceum]|uniref:Uncharacterized protein n=1 Tax=Haliangium ochraceum (strain DSM 14365 / JCM 11303 / SMP-2) TaxID=502025 RepID=D0LPA7_HALO1|nr:hypothetical protein [Haliangium ochraceum]ACY13472.1 conserved hypothetical protein [Haliangium ochraceum DSM 14365]